MIKIRIPEEKDKEELTNLVKDYVFSLEEEFYRGQWMMILDAFFFTRTDHPAGIENLTIFIAEDEITKKIVGIIVAEIRTNAIRQQYGDISFWYVDPNHHSEGIGRQLLEIAMKWVKNQNIGIIETNIRKTATNAMKGLEKAGFFMYYCRMRKIL